MMDDESKVWILARFAVSVDASYQRRVRLSRIQNPESRIQDCGDDSSKSVKIRLILLRHIRFLSFPGSGRLSK